MWIEEDIPLIHESLDLRGVTSTINRAIKTGQSWRLAITLSSAQSLKTKIK